MAFVTKSTSATNKSSGFKAKYRGYDKAMVSSWQYENKNSYDIINDYAKRINAGEWLSNEDRAKYKAAIDAYSSSGTNLRDLSRSFGQKYTAEDDKGWADTLASLSSGYDQINQYYGQWNSEEKYKKALADAAAWQKDYNEKMSYDLDAGKTEVDRLYNILGVKDEISKLKNDISILDQVKSDPYGTYRKEKDDKMKRLAALESTWAHAMDVYGGEDALKSLWSEKNQYYNLAKRVQDGARLGGVSDPESEYYDPDFAKYADFGKNIGWNSIGNATIDKNAGNILVYDDLKAATLVMNERALGTELFKPGMASSQDGLAGWINNTFGNAGEYNSENIDTVNTFRKMSDDELNTLAYYLQKDKENGTNLAEQYIGSMRETLNARVADEIAASKQGISQYLYAVEAGLKQFEEGRDALFSQADYIPQSATQIASGKIRENLEGQGVPVWYNFATGQWENEILGSSTGQIAYDVLSTSANMLPSILGSVAANVLAPGYGSYVGTALLGASAAGNAKAEMLNLGYSKEQANTYGVMVGVAEAAMEKALGGIPGLKGEGVFSGLAQKIFGKVDNALARAAITIGGNMLDEGLEEGLQTVIEPWLKEAATNVDWDSPTVDEVLYSSLLGALSSVGFSGGEVVSAVKTQISDNEQIKTQYAEAAPELITKAIEIGDEKTKKMAEAYQKKIDKGNSLSAGELKNLVSAINKVEEGGAERIAAESKQSIKVQTEDGKSTKIGKVSNIDNGNVTVELKDGTITDAKNVKFADEKAEMVFNTATERVGRVEGWTTETANAMIKAYESVSDMTPESFAKAWDEAYNLGKQRGAVSQLAAMPNASKLPEAVMNRAYNIGTVLGNANVTKVENVKGGSFRFDSSVTPEMQRKFTSKQKTDVQALKIISKALGINVEVFESPVNEKGKRVGENGSYDAATRTLRVDLHAGSDGEGVMMFTAAHELTHHMRSVSKDGFNKFADAVFSAFSSEGISTDEIVAKKLEDLKKNGRLEGLSESDAYDLAYEEAVADAAEGMLADSDALARLSSSLKAKDQTLWDRVKGYISNLVAQIKKAYAQLNPNSREGKMLRDMGDKYQELLNIWSDAVTEMAYTEEETVSIDVKSESVSPLMLSERTWTESDYITMREEMAKKIANALGVSVAKAKRYIDDVNSIAKMIANDRARLDYQASSFGSAFVSNVEYGGSFDYTTLCKKRRIYTGTFTEIQKRLRNTALTPDDILKIRNMLIEEGIEATCGLCYVEGSRANMGKFAQKFIELYKRDNPDGWIPDMADVNTPDGVEQMRIKHPEVYESYEYFWNHYGKLKDSDKALFASQQKPKLYEARKEYKGEILKTFKSDDSIDKKNRNGGIRMQSFSDFEIVHLIDTMQVIMDMSTVGLAGQAYTKVPEFAKAFGNTGLKINLSLIAKGVDADGKLIFDDREGMPHDTAFDLRSKYSKNVGTIIVTFTDDQLMAAMADDRIDFIIPFHRSQWKKGQYGAMGLPKGTKDYTFMQNEKLIKQTYHEYQGRMVKDKASNYMPNEYWDFSKSGKENAEAYLEMCAENNKRPKFYKLLNYDGEGRYTLKEDGSTDGYWKLLVDFKMYDNKGVGSPQTQVVPNFNMDEATKMLDEYEGGHAQYPVAHGVVDKFVSEYEKNKDIKYSDRDSSYSELDKWFESFTIEELEELMNDNSSIDEISEEINVKPEKVEILFYREGLGDSYVEDGRKAVMTQSRIDEAIKYNGASNPNYAQRLISRISPSDFIDLTVPRNGQDRTVFDSKVQGDHGNTMGNYDYESALKKSRDNPYLVIDVATGRVIGHNGRHRMRAMELLGINSVEIEVELYDEGIVKIHKGIIKDLAISSQFDTKTQTHISNLIPLNNSYRAEIEKTYGEKAHSDAKVKYQDRADAEESFSNRALLANALESAAVNEVEARKLELYKGRIEMLDAETKKLAELKREIKDISFGEGKRDVQRLKYLKEEARKTEARINLHDKKLLELEATSALKSVLERETKKAYAAAAQKGREALHRNVEGRKTTEVRHKIQSIAKELDGLLNRGTKERNVKKGESEIVRRALDLSNMLFASDDELLMNMNTVDAIVTKAEAVAMDEYVKLYEEYHSYDNAVTENKARRAELRMLMADLKAEFKDVLERERKRISKAKAADTYDALIKAYKGLKGAEESYIRNAFDADALEHLEKMREDIGDKVVSEMTREQLEDVYKAFKMIKTMVQNSNKLFNKEIKENVEVLGSQAMSEVEAKGHRERFTAEGKMISTLTWNNLKPIYLMERVGSEVMNKLTQAIMKAESKWAVDMVEAKEYADEQIAKNAARKWDYDKKTEFTSGHGQEFKLSLGQIMTIYAYTKRGEQALEHLRTDGFVFDKLTEKKGLITYELNDKTAYKIDDATLLKILGTLTAEQKAYVDAMQKYLSDVMGKKGNEVANKMYGIDLFGEENYFPIRSEGAYLERAREQAKGESKIKNKGYTKKTTPGARNAIVLSDFNKVWSEHVAEMSSYHAFVLPMEDFYKVYNYQSKSGENDIKRGVIPAITNAYGEAATKAIDQMLSDLNGGARSDSREDVFKKAIGLYKKSKVMGSMSVVAQQPSAMMRAMAMIDPKYFAGKRVDGQKHAESWAEIKKYAPVAVIKDMGHFDVGLGKSSAEWLISDKTALEKFDDALSKLPSYADEVAWIAIWNAVKREVASQNKTMNTGSEEFLKIAGDRFEDVIRHTQVYDSTLARSGNMRSKSALMQIVTSFMAEPTTTINMLELAARSGDRGKMARTTAAVVASALINSVLVAIPYAMRDDDEDETFAEKYITALATSFGDNINPVNMLPIAKDIWSLAQGYNVDRTDMAMSEDLINSLKKLATELAKEDGEAEDIAHAIAGVIGDVAAFAGLPVDNLLREVKALFNFGKTIIKDIGGRETTWLSLMDALESDFHDETPIVGWFKGETKGDKLYDALVNGDAKYVARFKATYKDEDSYLSAVRKALRDNDPRMREAAEAYLNKDYATYNAIRDEIVSEGVFVRKLVTEALKAEINYLKDKQEN